eukprot:CAMPEP_0201697874 /NCGR_PEP_ID=MMETSP0578-20130828/14970_1 /ASSEMBLY_ACC=CAM_ASM_000663 /TAXON_ID=267565 /ORGANISM="Skeletonema grethea, Strain CCMP 1804" /LENGTH=127 /DNA_ID=CAMNT_0048184231 /DNA_START=74 /DNA_END=457 /DNA_ORIENTATION=+
MSSRDDADAEHAHQEHNNIIKKYTTIEFEVFGRVQGVFFHKHTKAKAEELGLTGTPILLAVLCRESLNMLKKKLQMLTIKLTKNLGRLWHSNIGCVGLVHRDHKLMSAGFQTSLYHHLAQESMTHFV